MAQITFFATDDDCQAMWGMIFFELRLTAYPDPWFGELPVPGLTTPADVAANLAAYPRVAPGLDYYLTSSEWSLEPLEYRLCNDNPNFAPHWNVNQRYGGPSIRFIPSFGYPWHIEGNQIVAGMFSNYAYYYSAIDHRQIIARPDGLVAAWKSLGRWLRCHGKTVRANNGQRAVVLSSALIAHKGGVILRFGPSVFVPVAGNRRE